VRKTSRLTAVCPVYFGQLVTTVHCAYKTDGGYDTPFSTKPVNQSGFKTMHNSKIIYYS
jgi:hypothetical protein